MPQLSRRSVLIGLGACCVSLFSGCVDVLGGGLSEDEERALQHYQDGFERNGLAREYFADAVEEFEGADYGAAQTDFADASDLFRSSVNEFEEVAPFYADKLDNPEIGEIASEASEASGTGASIAGSITDTISFYQIGSITEENLVENFYDHTEEYGNESFAVPPVSEFENAL